MISPFDSLPVAILLWVIVYVADYYLTLYGQKLWRQNASSFVSFQGSYELNPYYQSDIDANKRLSRRFILMLAFGAAWLTLVWFTTSYLNILQVFQAGLGFLLLQEIVILSTHVQNVRTFKLAATPDALQGQVTYSRWISLDGTAWRYGYWGLIFLLFAIMMGSWFFAGGALAGLNSFFRYRRRSQRMRQQPKVAST